MTRRLAASICAVALSAPASWSQEGDDLFEFFEEEARVITASHRPHARHHAPATVHVVTAEEIVAFGTYTLWDALRSIPGLDVVSSRSAQAAVSIRGLNKITNNRTLILIDGRRARDGYSESVNWDGLPVPTEEIERIEVVEGPASALYGANAVNGVINIVTKSPQQIDGSHVSAGAGQRGARSASFLHGGSTERVSYKLAFEGREFNRFEDGDLKASEALKAHFGASFVPDDQTRLELSAGGSDIETDISLGGLGTTFEDGERRFVHAEADKGNTSLRLSWTRGSTLLEQFAASSEASIDYGTSTVVLQRNLSLTSHSSLVVGADFRRDDIDSDIVAATHNQWSLFFENQWKISEPMTLWSSARLDRHPHAGFVVSPRVSAVYVPSVDHVVRVTGATAFRNPSLIENHVLLEGSFDLVELGIPAPLIAPLRFFEFAVEGNAQLNPERVLFLEAAHGASFGKLRTHASAFYYELNEATDVLLTYPEPDSSVVRALASFRNLGTTRARGFETQVDWAPRERVSLFANYSYQRLRGTLDSQVAGRGTPTHKLNGGGRFNWQRLDCAVNVHWVGRTLWNKNDLLAAEALFAEVESYGLVNLAVAYAIPSPHNGLRLEYQAFNLLSNDHFQVLPEQDSGLIPVVGHSGEIIRSRHSLRLSYHF